jgi:hypothetical protein
MLCCCIRRTESTNIIFVRHILKKGIPSICKRGFNTARLRGGREQNKENVFAYNLRELITKKDIRQSS